MTPAAFERAVGYVRTAVAGIAVAAALFLVARISLIASFRAALIVLAALEVLSSGRRMLRGGAWAGEAASLVVKVVVLAVAYLALGA